MGVGGAAGGNGPVTLLGSVSAGRSRVLRRRPGSGPGRRPAAARMRYTTLRRRRGRAASSGFGLFVGGERGGKEAAVRGPGAVAGAPGAARGTSPPAAGDRPSAAARLRSPPPPARAGA